MSMENTNLSEYTNNNTDTESEAENNAMTNSDTTSVHDPEKTQNVTKGRVTMDDRLAKSVIGDQAGSLVNAWREALQNGIDKHDSTLAELRFNKRRSFIQDDGFPLDFTDEEIEKLLTCLGLSSKEVDDDDTIGQFGVGLGKVISVGAVTVMSGSLSLHFDFGLKANRHRQEPFEDELDYARVPLEQPVDGVKIFVHHYEDEVPSYSYRWKNFEKDIKKTMGYASFMFDTEVKINDELIDNGDPYDEVTRQYQITTETENAYLAVEHNKDDDIDIYSNGLYVKTIDGNGLAGTIVTKGNLELDLARNDIKEGCEKWAAITDTLTDLREDILTAVPDSQLTRDAREAIVEMMSEDERLQEEWSGRDVFRMANGDKTSLEAVQDSTEIGWGTKGDRGADQLVEEGETVLHESDSANDILKDESDSVNVTSDTFDVEDRAEEQGIDTGFNQIDNEFDMRPKERRRLLFARLLAERLDIDREIKWGESEEVDAWTDGITHITLTASGIDRGRFPQWSHQVYDMLAKLWAYDCDSRENDFGAFMKEDYYDFHQDDDNLETFHDLCEEAEQKSLTQLFQYYSVS